MNFAEAVEVLSSGACASQKVTEAVSTVAGLIGINDLDVLLRIDYQSHCTPFLALQEALRIREKKMNWTEAILLMATGPRTQSWRMAALRTISRATGIKDQEWLSSGCKYDDVGDPQDVRDQYAKYLENQTVSDEMEPE